MRKKGGWIMVNVKLFKNGKARVYTSTPEGRVVVGKYDSLNGAVSAFKRRGFVIDSIELPDDSFYRRA